MLSGTRKTPLPVNGIELADTICFDIAYDDGIFAQVERGAEMLAVQTSNASFIFTDQIDQQSAMTRLRRSKPGAGWPWPRPTASAAVIRPDGSIAAEAEPQTTSVPVEQVDLMSGVTPTVWLGAWPGRLFTLLTCVGLVLGTIAYRRNGKSSRRAVTPDGVENRPKRSNPHEENATTEDLGRVIVVIPTYNEALNLPLVVERLRAAQPDVDVLVVDDSSPDGTGDDRRRDRGRADPQVSVLHRTAKEGLGAAYLARLPGGAGARATT